MNRPCEQEPDTWFSDAAEDLEVAKDGCSFCPEKIDCYAGALARREHAGVWGGVLFKSGSPGRPPGRPRKEPAPAS